MWLVLGLMGVGLIMVGSASISEGLVLKHDAFFFVKRHAFYLVLCFAMLAILLQVPMRFWEQYSGQLLLLALVMLVMVLIVGRTVNGSTRWLPLGPLNFQPSEFAKLALLTYLASYLVRKQEEVRDSLKGFLKPLFILFVLTILLLSQPDLGSMIVLFVVTMGLLFLAGARLFQFGFLMLAGVGGVVALILISPYRLKRVTMFWNPWQDPFGSGYQLTQSLMAFGRGGWFGVGLGNSVQKLEYLPEAHTDFVFSILGEELGYIGVVVVLAMLFCLAWKALMIGRRALLANRLYEGYLACGISIWFSFQSVVNVGAACGLLPTKGLTLPLVSYGGSSLIMVAAAVAILLRIDHEMRVSGMQARHLES
ncbi:cell division protein FtsW [Dongshaea marina]|uniref:cell division protein FtsW n=1 Tax=Dongshaea marina TaxID=2047966 RepID=UPI001F1E9CDA|nr:cell division protein FtsW [Dongshaea marina]